MLRGLIDIGSNTVKAFVYEVENETCCVKASARFYLHLYSYIQNGNVSDIGASKLADIVTACLGFFHEHECLDCHAFATAALRDACNGQEIICFLEKKCGIFVELLSGEQEALCDMLSMSCHTGIKKALGMDLGGGSGQIFLYDEYGLLKSASYPIGALKVADDFVKNHVPSNEEKEEHNVVIEDGFATFETDHFSTYILTEATSNSGVVNPDTSDNIVLYVSIGIISLVGIVGCLVYIKRKKSN